MTRFVSHPVAQAREATKWSPFGVSRQSLEVEFCELRFLGELRRDGVLRSSALRSILVEQLNNSTYNRGMSHFNDSSPDARLLEPRDVLARGERAGIDERVAALMGALSNPTRIRALFALLESGETSAGELAKAVGMSPSATSHQLRVLRDLGLVLRRREGRAVFYALADDHLEVLLKESLYHVDHNRLRGEGKNG